MGKKLSKEQENDPETGFYDARGRWCIFDESRRGFFDPMGNYFRFDEKEPDRYYWDDNDVCYEFEKPQQEQYPDVTDDPDFWTDWDLPEDENIYETIPSKPQATAMSKKEEQTLPPPPKFPPPPVPKGSVKYDDLPPPLPPKDYKSEPAQKNFPDRKTESIVLPSQIVPRTPPIPPRPSITKRPKSLPEMPSRTDEDPIPADVMAEFEKWYRRRREEQLRRKSDGFVPSSSTSSFKSALSSTPTGDSGDQSPPPTPPVPRRPRRRPPPEVIAAIEASVRKDFQQKEVKAADQSINVESHSGYSEITPVKSVPTPGRQPPARPLLRPRRITETLTPMPATPRAEWWKRITMKKSKKEDNKKGNGPKK